MPHLLVRQLQFTRQELVRCLEGVSDEEARQRFEPMNCISWIVGHLANQENFYWVRIAQGEHLEPELNALVGYGRPPSTPPLDCMWQAWHNITQAADRYLETLDAQQLALYASFNGKQLRENLGTMLLRNIHHYWFHLGEAYAIRQLLGHTDLPEFVGDMYAAGYPDEINQV